MKKKSNLTIVRYRYLIVVLVLLLAIIFTNNEVFAALTKDSSDASVWTKIDKTLGSILDGLSKVGMNFVTASLATLISGIAILLYMVLQTVFIITGIPDGVLSIPFPDTVIFNRLSIFDANFVNPDSASPIYAIRQTISSIYDSFVIIAIAMFTIIAMVIGIKLAVSSLAAEKAKYKHAIGSWIAGILLLICLKWVLAGMFLLNEKIVQVAYDLSKENEMKFNVISVASIPLIGSTISEIVSWFGVNAESAAAVPVAGYAGLVLKYLLLGIGGNIVASMVAFVVLGQTVAIIGTYLRRVFYTLFLGIVGPLIIAADTINRSVGKGSQVLANWFKQLALSIFMQSFHAIFLTILISLMVGIGSENSGLSPYLRAIIIIILTNSLLKFEKLIKQLFGVGDSLVGDIKGGAMKAIATMGAIKRAGSAIGDNTRKVSDAKKRKTEIQSKKVRLESAQRMLNSKFGNGSTATGSVGHSQLGDDSKYSSSTAASKNNYSNGQTVHVDEEIKGILRNINNQLTYDKSQQIDNQLKDLDKQEAKAYGDIAAARFASLLAPVNVIAGAGIGIGMDDMAVGGNIIAGLDYAAEKIGRRGADSARSRLYDETKEKGRENPELLREKTSTVIKQNITNTINMKDLREIRNIMSGKFDVNGSKQNKPLGSYRYIAERNNEGHGVISKSVDNL